MKAYANNWFARTQIDYFLEDEWSRIFIKSVRGGEIF